jgi:hypothetical protein
MNSTIKTTAKVAEELNQSNENTDIKNEGIQHTKAKLGESLKEEMGEQSTAQKYRQTT